MEGVLYASARGDRNIRISTALSICLLFGIPAFTVDKGRILTCDYLENLFTFEDGTPAKGIASYKEVFDSL